MTAEPGVGLFTVTGGTGRFEGASGFYKQFITFSAPPGTSSYANPYSDVLEERSACALTRHPAGSQLFLLLKENTTTTRRGEQTGEDRDQDELEAGRFSAVRFACPPRGGTGRFGSGGVAARRAGQGAAVQGQLERPEHRGFIRPGYGDRVRPYRWRGEATHLGRFTVHGDVGVVVATGIPHGTWTLTAANGDQLFLDMTGYGIDDHHGLGQFTVVGGTGRFEGASGYYEQIITFEFPLGTADVMGYTDVLEGTISLRNGN